jgi:hypothetical protein
MPMTPPLVPVKIDSMPDVTISVTLFCSLPMYRSSCARQVASTRAHARGRTLRGMRKMMRRSYPDGTMVV